MSIEVYTVEWVQAGQARPYADTEYRANVTITRDDKPVKWSDDVVKRRIQGLVHTWVEPGAPNDNWSQPHLKEFRNIGPGKWYVRVALAYTD